MFRQFSWYDQTLNRYTVRMKTVQYVKLCLRVESNIISSNFGTRNGRIGIKK